MKLVVIIPAYNEEENIQKTIQSIPKKICGIDRMDILVIDDGSTDKTAKMALNAGASKVISHHKNLGVGAAFMTGVRNSILRDADVVVTLDADSQFDSKQITDLVVPILNNQLNVVMGSRFLKDNPKGIPRMKLFGNKVFSRIISLLLKQKISDSQTGFRAYSKDALLNISIINDFTYTQEVLIDLKFKGFRIGEIPVSVRYDENRKSKVVKNIFQYSIRVVSIIIKTVTYHRPIMAFGILGAVLLGGGILAKVLTILNVILGISAGLSTGFIILGIVAIMMGLFASIVFKRQAFTEKDIRQHLNKLHHFTRK